MFILWWCTLISLVCQSMPQTQFGQTEFKGKGCKVKLTHRTMGNWEINLQQDRGSHFSVTLCISYSLGSVAVLEEEWVLKARWIRNICRAICCIHPYGLNFLWQVVPWKSLWHDLLVCPYIVFLSIRVICTWKMSWWCNLQT